MSPIYLTLLLSACLVSSVRGIMPVGVRTVNTRMTQSVSSHPVHHIGGVPMSVGHMGVGTIGHIGAIGGVNGLGAMGAVDPYLLGLKHGAAKGFQKGAATGFHQGQSVGFVKGKVTGVNKGIQAGFHRGKMQGFHKGKLTGFHQGTQHGFHGGKIQGFHKGKMTGFKAGLGSVNRLTNHLMATGMPYMNTFGGPRLMSGYGTGFGRSMYAGHSLTNGLVSGHGLYGSGLGVAGGTVTLGVHQPGPYGMPGRYAPIKSSYSPRYGNKRVYNQFPSYY